MVADAPALAQAGEQRLVGVDLRGVGGQRDRIGADPVVDEEQRRALGPAVGLAAGREPLRIGELGDLREGVWRLLGDVVVREAVPRRAPGVVLGEEDDAPVGGVGSVSVIGPPYTRLPRPASFTALTKSAGVT